jgi:hypothetical protein
LRRQFSRPGPAADGAEQSAHVFIVHVGILSLFIQIRKYQYVIFGKLGVFRLHVLSRKYKIRSMQADQTQETLETAFCDQDTRETVALMLAAGCTAREIWAWLSFLPKASGVN